MPKHPIQAERERFKRCAGALKAAQCDYCGGCDGVAVIQVWFGPFKLSKPRAACLECRRAKIKNRFRFVRVRENEHEPRRSKRRKRGREGRERMSE